MRFFLLLFLLPSLLFCLDKQKAERLYHESFAYWSQYQKLLQELNQINSEVDFELFMQVLNSASESCKKALDNCNLVLNDIAKKAKKGDKRIWHYDLHEDCKKAKRVFKPEFEKVQNLLEQNSVRRKAILFIKELVELAKPAYAKYHQHPSFYPDIHKLIAALEESKLLFENVLKSLDESIPLIDYPVLEPEAKKINTYRADFQGAIKTIDIHTQDWIQIKNSSRDEQIKLLQITPETENIFEERDLQNHTFETLLKMFALLEKLSMSSYGVEKTFVERHLVILRKYFKIEE